MAFESNYLATVQVALPIALFLGSIAGLIAGAAPYPAHDESCEIMSYQIKTQFGAALLAADFSVCPRAPQEVTRSHASIARLPGSKWPLLSRGGQTNEIIAQPRLGFGR